MSSGTLLGQMFVVALGASVLTLAGQQFVEPIGGASSIEVEGEAPREQAADLYGALVRIESRLAEASAIELAVPRRPAQVPQGSGVEAGDRDEILDRLGAIEALLSGARQLRAEAPLNRVVPVDMANIRSLERLVELDRRAAERDVHLMSTSEAIDRFGYPDRTGAASSHFDMFWVYERIGPDGGVEQALELYFTDGLVLGFQSNVPN